MQRVNLSPLKLASASGLRREAPRPPHLRQPGYDEDFDWLTIFYDCIRAADPRWIVLMGPPLGKLDEVVLSALKAAIPVPGVAFLVRDLDRHSQIWISRSDSTLRMGQDPFEPSSIEIQPNCCDLFRDKRVLFTKSRDNDLQWIRDWAYFHVRAHGTNAALLYDNGSRRYASDEVREVLARIPGMDVAVVVDWPFKFGPQGVESHWDSDFCEYGIMEHARHRFLALAEGVINADIDELVFTKDNSSVYERMRASPAGFVLYPGVWIDSVRPESAGFGRRHADFLYRCEGIPEAAPKWTVAPRRCPPATQWRTHHISGMNADRESSQGISYWHFKGINTNWKELRLREIAPGPTQAPDPELVRAMKLFDGEG